MFIWCDSKLHKVTFFRGKGLTEEEQKDSGGEQKDEDEGLGPRSNVSLLDQHQHLKEKAEGLYTLPCTSLEALCALNQSVCQYRKNKQPQFFYDFRSFNNLKKTQP